jgi:hypothetical protein
VSQWAHMDSAARVDWKLCGEQAQRWKGENVGQMHVPISV